MSESTQLSRSRVAVLAISGVAAAYGIYTIYNTISERSPKGALHRSNAIRRHRPERHPSSRASVKFRPPSDDAPLGTVVIRNSAGTNEIESNIADVGIPKAADLDFFEAGLGENQSFEHDLHVNAIECILYAASTVRSQRHRREMGAMGLHGLPEAIVSRDINAIQGFASDIQAILSIDVTVEQMFEGMKRFTESEAFTTPESLNRDADGITFAETEIADAEADAAESRVPEPSQGLKGLLYHIAEADAKRKAYEHRGIHCEECGEHPIRGVRWHCLNCPDFDLCSTCEANSEHQKTHVFAKIKIPLPMLSQPTKEWPLWYPGDPRKYHAPLSAALKKRLGDEYGFGLEQMDANYDQFTCIANVPWPSDPNRILGAIDRRAFNKALTSERWPQRFRPNALYDRMFAFYDTNSDGFIGFEEFISGIAYLRGPQRFTPLRRALEGFDIDGDGYVDRDDFLRLVRAKYEIQKLLICEVVEAREKEQTQSAMETLRSSLPISSIFSAEEIPLGEVRLPGAKTLDSVGDMQPRPGAPTIFDDNAVLSEQSSRRNGNGPGTQPREHLPHQLSRVEGVIDNDGIGVHVFSNELGRVAPNLPKSSNAVDAEDNNSREGSRSSFGEATGAIEADEPLDQDALWEVIMDGFHEMLDPVFEAKELDDQELIDSREERMTWRKEIDKAVKAGPDFHDELESASQVDPLMAIAKGSLGQMNGNQGAHHLSSASSTFTGALVPTDPLSLQKREAEIAETPLEELLESTGYSVIEDTENSSYAVPSHGGLIFEQIDDINAAEDRTPQDQAARSTCDRAYYTNGHSQDPTMPQNRPSSDQSQPTASGQPRDENYLSKPQHGLSAQASASNMNERPPSKERLIILAGLEKRDRELQALGGPGKLSFDEVESIVKADATGDLKGLVKSWLEWASF